MDTKWDERLSDKLRTKLFVKLKHVINHFNTEVDTIKQFLPSWEESKSVKSPEIMKVTFSKKNLEEYGKYLCVC